MRRPLLAGLLVCAASGCGGGSGSSTGKVHLTPNVIAGVQVGAQAAGLQAALRIGSPLAATLHSLKYYVTSIQLCQKVARSGSGFSSADGCIAIYENMAPGSPSYDAYTVTEAKDDSTPGRYIDLMTAAGQATLRRPVTLEVAVAAPAPDGGDDPTVSRAGVYRYGLINFYRPIKATAEFPVVGAPGQYFRTRAVTRINSGMTPDGRFNSQWVEIGDTLSGPTEETTYMLDNGGALFTFQKPFTITEADLANQAEIKIDLVFNPDNFGQAHDIHSCADGGAHAICDPANNVVIDMPFVRMNPVPRKAGQRTRKETYLVEQDDSAQLRIELYYNDGDPEAGIQGVDTALVYRPTALMPTNKAVASDYLAQTGSLASSDATVTLQDYRQVPSLSGLRRRQGGTLNIHCLFPGTSFCPSEGATVPRAYSYVGDTVVSSD